MSVASLLQSLQQSPLALAVSRSDPLVGAALQVVHVLGFILLLASLVLVSLRILGHILPRRSLPLVAREATRLLWIGFALAATSGALLFVATPARYAYNAAFLVKMALFALAVLVQLVLVRGVARREHPAPRAGRLAVALSLACWFGVGIAGRVIGFI